MTVERLCREDSAEEERRNYGAAFTARARRASHAPHKRAAQGISRQTTAWSRPAVAKRALPAGRALRLQKRQFCIIQRGKRKLARAWWLKSQITARAPPRWLKQNGSFVWLAASRRSAWRMAGAPRAAAVIVRSVIPTVARWKLLSCFFSL